METEICAELQKILGEDEPNKENARKVLDHIYACEVCEEKMDYAPDTEFIAVMACMVIDTK